MKLIFTLRSVLLLAGILSCLLKFSYINIEIALDITISFVLCRPSLLHISFVIVNVKICVVTRTTHQYTLNLIELNKIGDLKCNINTGTTLQSKISIN